MQVVLVGCGRMGGALLRGWTAAGIGPVLILDPALEEVPPGARRLAAVGELAGASQPLCVVLAVKPGLVRPALQDLAPHLTPGALVISIAAGVRLDALRAACGAGVAVVRAMPNTPAAIGKGVVGAVSEEALDARRLEMTEKLLAAAGELFWLEREALIDPLTAVSGSGPAYFYRFTELLAQAGRELGLDCAMATRLAELTLVGAAAWLEASGQDAGALRVEVTSPNGVTAAALQVFDTQDRLGRLVADALGAAVARSAEMGG